MRYEIGNGLTLDVDKCADGARFTFTGEGVSFSGLDRYAPDHAECALRQCAYLESMAADVWDDDRERELDRADAIAHYEATAEQYAIADRYADALRRYAYADDYR